MKTLFKPKIILTALFSVSLAACFGGSGGSSDSTSVAGLATPSEMDLIHDASSESAQMAGLKVNYAAFSDAGTDYTNDLANQESHTYHPAVEPLSIVNEILCFMDQMNPDEFVNDGQYIAMIDDAKCGKGNNKSGASSGGSGSASSSDKTTYTKAIVESTRASSSSPMDVKVWVLEKDGDQPSVIKVHTVVTEGVSTSAPFGAFTMRFDGYGLSGGQATGTASFNGHLKTVSTTQADAAFTFYESGTHGSDGSGNPVVSKQQASVEVNASGTSGRAETKVETGPDTNSDGVADSYFDQGHYQLAYNSTHAFGKEINTSDEACLDRNTHNEYVWRYDLYNATTGAKVQVNSGFPFTFDNSGTTQYGHVSYWGIWTEEPHNFSTGDTITSKGFSGSTAQDYTVVQGPGRLIKYTRQTINLSDLGNTKFNYWDGSQDFQVVYNSNSSVFQKVATVSYGSNGMSITTLGSPVNITVPDYGLNMWSDQLGGQVKYAANDTKITFFKQQFLNGSEDGTGEPFASSTTLNLTCLERCPQGTFTTAMAANYSSQFDSAFNYDDSALHASGGIQNKSYTFDSASLKLTDNTSTQSVEFDSAVTSSNFDGWGYQSGPMVADASGITNFWEVWDSSSSITEYYVWETGLESWNKTTAVKDSSNSIVTFNKPIQFNYTHTTANDRNSDATYNGETYMLQYGGNGDLWGFQFNPDDTGERWYPNISLKDGTVVGESSEYIVLARELEKVMQNAAGGLTDCGTLSSNITPENALPVTVDATILQNTDNIPAITSDPKVIGGITQ